MKYYAPSRVIKKTAFKTKGRKQKQVMRSPPPKAKTSLVKSDEEILVLPDTAEAAAAQLLDGVVPLVAPIITTDVPVKNC